MTTSPVRSSRVSTALGYAAFYTLPFGIVSVICMIVIQSYVSYINMSVHRPGAGLPEGAPYMIPLAWILVGFGMLMVFFGVALLVGGLVGEVVPAVADSAALSLLAVVGVCLLVLIPAHFLVLHLIDSGNNPHLTYITDYFSYFVLPAFSLVGVAVLTGNQVRQGVKQVA